MIVIHEFEICKSVAVMTKSKVFIHLMCHFFAAINSREGARRASALTKGRYHSSNWLSIRINLFAKMRI